MVWHTTHDTRVPNGRVEWPFRRILFVNMVGISYLVTKNLTRFHGFMERDDTKYSMASTFSFPSYSVGILLEFEVCYHNI